MHDGKPGCCCIEVPTRLWLYCRQTVSGQNRITFITPSGEGLICFTPFYWIIVASCVIHYSTLPGGTVLLVPVPKLVPSPVPRPPVVGLFPNRFPPAGLAPKPDKHSLELSASWSISAVAMETLTMNIAEAFWSSTLNSSRPTEGGRVSSGSKCERRLVAKEPGAGAEGRGAGGGRAKPGRLITK